MIYQSVNKSFEQMIIQCSNEMKRLVMTKNEKDIEKLFDNLKEKRNYLLKSKIPENIARSSIISYVIKYHNIESLYKVKNIKDLTNELINSLPLNNVIESSLSNVNKRLKGPSSFRLMISFRKQINKEKKYLQLYFTIMMIIQNIQNIIEGIKILLCVNNKNIENQLSKLSFKNPYAILIIRDLINELIIRENNKEDEIVLKDVINNVKNDFLFHCPNCLGIFYISSLDSIIMFCPKDKTCLKPKEINDVKKCLDIKIKCGKCDKKIEIYENNYKCIKCNKYYCEECAVEHEKSDINNILINIYEIGYICEEHCELYSTFCGLCKQNLCKICKESHFHKVDEKIYELKEDLIETNSNKNLNDSTTLEEYTSIKLSAIYKYMKEFSYSNLFIRLAIWFSEEKKRLDEVGKKTFYFKKFFDIDFRKYYKKLIDNILEGKSEYFQLLEVIKEKYEKIEINIDNSFNEFNLKYLFENNKRNMNMTNWILEIEKMFVWIELYNTKIKLNSKIIKLNNKSKKLETDIELLKIKILALLKSNDLYTSYLIKLINRYLSDFLIRKLIEKYPTNFARIEITHKNFYEIANNFSNILFKNGNNFLDNLKNKLNLDIKHDLKDNDNIEKIKPFISNLKDNNKIKFINPLKIHNEIISANELNFVLDTFFYFKSPGNIIAHINIKPKESIKLKKINEDIPNINLLLFNMDNNNNFNSFNHYNNINDGTNENINVIITNEIINSNNSIVSEINENITEKIINNIENKKEDWLEIENDINKEIRNIISKIKEQIIGDFYESSINEKLNIIKILNMIFKNDYKDIYGKNTALTRGLSLYIDELIGKNNFKIDFSEYNEIKDIYDIIIQ